MPETDQTTDAERDWLSPTELANAVGVHPNTILNWLDAGKVAELPRIGHKRRIPRGEVDRLNGKSEAGERTAS